MRITDERLTAFINSLDTGNPAYLNELEKEARETNVPIIRTETQSLLRTLIVVNRPERILEDVYKRQLSGWIKSLWVPLFVSACRCLLQKRKSGTR